MKAIQIFFDIITEYQRKKYEFKFMYESHKMYCRIKYQELLKSK